VKVLILDLTHGGGVLAETYAENGHEVTAIDIYRNCPPGIRSRLSSLKVRVLEETPDETFDLAVSPVHCPDLFFRGASYERRLTHHQAVGELARFGYPIIEVTGAVAKTSSCHILAHILHSMGKRVLLLTSRGLVSMGDTIEILEEKASIAPATILRLSKMKGEWDYGIFECSLGGTGLADIGTVTNLSGEYPIAAGTRSSNAGKMQMIRSAKHRIVIAAEDKPIIEGEMPREAEVTTFGAGGDVRVNIEGGLRIGERTPAILTVNGHDLHFTLSSKFLAPSYLTGLNAAAALAFAAGAEPKFIAEALSSFEGVPGRGEVHKEGEADVIRERNPGVSARSIEWNIRMLEEYYGVKELSLVVDPVTVKVCEKMDLDEIADVVSRSHCLTAAYVIDRGTSKDIPGTMIRVMDKNEIPRSQGVMLWCIKEGYT
jgi:UDP-N-acetylmuramyl pentapeptide synthase